jgi:uncharacterized membrane protein
MKQIRNYFFPLVLFALASAVGVGLLLGRILWTGHWRQLYLVWNLFLAWLPLGLALLAVRIEEHHGLRHWRFGGVALAWLMFFPNAPYIFTDLVHLGTSRHPLFWVDLAVILAFAWTGLMVGLFSLQLMHRVIAERLGWLVGWLFAGVAAGLSGVGIYIGRFLRWNSWDVVVQPIGLLADLLSRVPDVPSHKRALLVMLLFSVFVALTYVTLHAFTVANHRRAGHVPPVVI